MNPAKLAAVFAAAVLIATSLKLAGYFGDAALKNKALSALNRGDDLLARAVLVCQPVGCDFCGHFTEHFRVKQ